MASATDELREALIALSLPAPEQVRVVGPGCVACDLLSSFEFASREVGGELTGEARLCLEAIDRAMDGMSEEDYRCGDAGVLARPAWEELRVLSGRALDALGWAGDRLAPYRQRAPGVWERAPQDDGGSG